MTSHRVNKLKSSEVANNYEEHCESSSNLNLSAHHSTGEFLSTSLTPADACT
jgi:hypothetical protein